MENDKENQIWVRLVRNFFFFEIFIVFISENKSEMGWKKKIYSTNVKV